MAKVKCNTIDGKIVEVEENTLIPRPCAYALIVNDKKELLVEDAKEEGGKYWFVGGGLEKGEDPTVSLKREAIEEAGVNIKVLKRLKSLEYCYYHNKLNKYFRCQSDFFLCEYLSKSDQDSGDVKTKWLKLEEIDVNEFHALIGDIIEILKKTFK
jgi:8-oxo-dGTP pyrophosphatase MutT (NUDIX family)